MEDKFYNQIQEDNRESGGYDKHKINFLIREIGNKKKILDVGCNDGFIGEIFLKRNNQVYGFDIVKKNLAKAGKKGIKVKYFKIGSGPFPYAPNFFDIVILGDVIEHIFDTDQLLRECKRVLKPKGKLLLSTPNVASFGRRFMLLFGTTPFLEHSLELTTNGLPSVGHIRYYTKDTLREQLEYNKFTVKIVEGNGIYLTPFLKSSVLGKLFSSLSPILMCVALKNDK